MFASIVRKHPRSRAMSRVLTTAFIAVMIAMSLMPLAMPEASANTCPPGYKPGPSTETVDADGTVTRTPGGCIPDITINPGTLGVDSGDSSDPEIPINPEVLVTPTPTPKIDVEKAPLIDVGPQADDQTPPIINPPGPIDPNVPIDPAVNSASIFIDKHVCPADFDAAASDFFHLTEYCQGSMFGVVFGVSDGGSALATQATGDVYTAAVEFTNLPAVPVSIYEQVPAGFGAPIVFCGGLLPVEPGPPTFVKQTVLDGNQIFYTLSAGENVFCKWFNIPTGGDEGGEGTVVIAKRGCPAGFDADAADIYDLSLNCQEPMNGVTFGVSDGAAAIATGQTGAVQESAIEFTGLPAAPLSIYEQVPDGYGAPVVFCGGILPGEQGPLTSVKQTVLDGNQIFYILGEGEYLVCNWFNVPTGGDGEGGSITIYKWTCPAGYDPFALGANPTADCLELTDGIPFTFEDPVYGPVQSVTGGESDPGTVYFSGSVAGTYTVTETVPEGTAEVFVFDCTGSSIAMVHPTPLSVGNTLTIDLTAGDEVVCHWYNVPEYEDATGKLTVRKHACEASVFTSAYDCEIYEGGVSFSLYGWNDNAWTTIGGGTTGATGTFTWSGLTAGAYRLDEVGAEWCHAASDDVDGEGNLVVSAGYETVVDIYNCSIAPTTTGKGPATSGKMPTKFPNTGAGPVDDGDGSHGTLFLLLAGAVAFLATGLSPVAKGRTATPVASGSRPARAMRLVKPSSLLLTLLAALTLVTTATAQPPVIAPTDSEVASVADWREAIDRRLPAIPHSVGDRPVSIQIDAASVDAEVEVLEIVNGEMQAPTGAEVVSWYKETAKLGQGSNAVLAGHLNYWGVPEGVFFHLADLQEGDEIELTGVSGAKFRYRVEWVQLVDTATAPVAELVGPTDEESLTLITCGGEWDAAAGEYLQRTIVRATRVTSGS